MNVVVSQVVSIVVMVVGMSLVIAVALLLKRTMDWFSRSDARILLDSWKVGPPLEPVIDRQWDDDLQYADSEGFAFELSDGWNLLDLDPWQFEQLVRMLLKAMGFAEVRLTRVGGDGGIDLVAVNEAPVLGGKVAIQVKRYALHRKVDVRPIREIVGSAQRRNFTKQVVMTTSDFTAPARDEAARLSVELYNGQHLLWLFRKHLQRDFVIVSPVPGSSESSTDY
ncbi:restriction endonuclease [Streptosporangium canum]|uniref:restriction endonuclease n=1 Tax=Streptosporangium canum TaxID=324952 RepID=UPI000B87EC9B|nr:restriction endonuclease [Streptosporangium canum]